MIKSVKTTISYKMIIFFSLFLITLLFLMAFGLEKYNDYQATCKEISLISADNTVTQITTQVDERLYNLQLYYQESLQNNISTYILENPIQYSEHSQYMSAFKQFTSGNAYDKYVREFTFINTKTAWVMSNKGLYPLEQLYNDEVINYYLSNNTSDKTYWSYSDKDSIAEIIDINYRTTIETSGLMLSIRTPLYTTTPHILLLVNISMATHNSWIDDIILPYQNIVILDDFGNLIYQNTEVDISLLDSSTKEFSTGQDTFVIAHSTSEVLNWHYYVLHNVEESQGSFDFSLEFILLFTIFMLGLVLFATYLLYRPIASTLNMLYGDSAKQIKGNEFVFFNKRTLALREHNKELTKFLFAQQDNLKELFQLKLLQNIVSKEEFNAYIEKFALQAPQQFVCTSLLLDLSTTEHLDLISEDAMYLNILQSLSEKTKTLAWLPPIYTAGALFMIFEGNCEDDIIHKIEDFHQCFQNECTHTYELLFSIGVSATHDDIEQIRIAYRESIYALTFKPQEATTTSSKKYITNCQFYFSPQSSTERYNKKYELDIQEAIKTTNKAECLAIINALCDHLTVFNCNQNEIALYIMRFVDAILLTALDAKIEIQDVSSTSLPLLYRDLFVNVNLARIKVLITNNLIIPILNTREAHLSNQTYRLLEEIEGLIDKTHGDITLTECADALHISSTQIWKILKSERNTTFSACIEDYKIEKAKKLLLTTNLSVAEIAASLNYTNTQNFIRFFNKKTGLTPGKFRIIK